MIISDSMSDHTYCKRRAGPKQREIHRLRRMIRAKDELIRELRKKLKIYGIDYTPNNTQNTIINFRSTKSKMLQVHDFMTSVQKLSMESIKQVIKRLVLKYFPSVIKFSNVEALKLQHLLSINNAQFQKLRNFVALQDKWVNFSCHAHVITQKKVQLSYLGLNLNNWSWGTEKLPLNKENIKELGFIAVKDFKDLLYVKLSHYFEVNMMEFPSQWGENVIYVALFGDQKKAMAGPSYEDTYNETFCIVNSVLKTPVSPSHLHIFAVYEDTDKSSHLTKTFSSLHAQISSLQNTVYKNTNSVYTIKFIYMSDPARVVSALGYQPASSSYPPSVELKSPSDIPVSFDLENIYENSSVFNDAAAAETSSKEGGNSKKKSTSDVFNSIEEVGKSLHSHFSRYFSNFSRIRNRGLRLKWALQNYYLSKM